MDNPNLTGQPIIWVDSTPDNYYPIRILEAYLENSKLKYVTFGLSKERSLVYDEMNKNQDQRTEILEKAIQILKSAI